MSWIFSTIFDNLWPFKSDIIQKRIILEYWDIEYFSSKLQVTSETSGNLFIKINILLLNIFWFSAAFEIRNYPRHYSDSTVSTRRCASFPRNRMKLKQSETMKVLKFCWNQLCNLTLGSSIRQSHCLFEFLIKLAFFLSLKCHKKYQR